MIHQEGIPRKKPAIPQLIQCRLGHDLGKGKKTRAGSEKVEVMIGGMIRFPVSSTMCDWEALVAGALPLSRSKPSTLPPLSSRRAAIFYHTSTSLTHRIQILYFFVAGCSIVLRFFPRHSFAWSFDPLRSVLVFVAHSLPSRWPYKGLFRPRQIVEHEETRTHSN